MYYAGKRSSRFGTKPSGGLCAVLPLGHLKKPHAAHLHRIFSRHIAQKILTYVSMPAILKCRLPTKSTAHLNDGRFLEMPFTPVCIITDRSFLLKKHRTTMCAVFCLLRKVLLCTEYSVAGISQARTNVSIFVKTTV